MRGRCLVVTGVAGRGHIRCKLESFALKAERLVEVGDMSSI